MTGDSEASARAIAMQAAEATVDGRTAYLYAVQDLLEAAVGVDLVMWNDIDLVTGSVTIDGRDRAQWEWLVPNVAATAPDNPMVHRFLETRRRVPHRMSDVVSARELRSSQLWTDLFRHMDAQDQVGMPTRFDGYPYIRGWALNRSHGTFDDHAMEVLTGVQGVLNLLEDLVLAAPAELRGPAADDPRLDTLTPRERQVLGLLAHGWTAAHIGRSLRISPRTVRKHLEHIYDKVGIRDRLLVVQLFGRARP